MPPLQGLVGFPSIRYNQFLFTRCSIFFDPIRPESLSFLQKRESVFCRFYESGSSGILLSQAWA
ncbi:Uncharacterized protein dnm_084580 [Desulfonema magnum]|uniref:Uncharacterized protein n=1 Tax=Desulfonema magnum TaxID=45655 RepID=A0A975BW93_9BACT|nr:Uncharacterized protein dnm_084580 [Desulfonema magnum]